MQDVEGFTVRYDTIKDYNITKMKPLKGVFYNIRYYKSQNTNECSNANPISVSLEELIILLLNEITDRDITIKNLRSCLPLKSA